ncbi:SMP-30/gluconolactonase/LRE family protein [Confluentibacter flavum]|uniref:Gluconolaconase n=1 Tax=Confluentibacter flavum TaxID=1909700 RepID=A0A2N3HNX4_9FLAO|nr:SMP-30/gluconolactonase/LRE family protein [Confluentibacter flavum]PKQ46683.1 gluconolaconase [Confluentibacter flavum]
MNLKLTNRIFNSVFLVVVTFAMVQCKQSTAPEWQETNEALISQHSLSVRELTDLPENGIASNLEAGKVINLDKVDSLELHPGVNAKIFWGTGTMVSVIQMAPNSKIPDEVLSEDRFLFVQEGSINQLINDSAVTLASVKREEPDGSHSGTPKTEFVYLKKGTKSSITAGDSGARLLELYSPLRLDYLKQLGIENLPSDIIDVKNTQEPNIEFNKVYDLYDFQLTKLAEGAHSRLISGRNTQLSFISMDPGSTFPHHIHPEEQMMFVMRGECDEIILDGKARMVENDVVRLPGNMVHGAYISELGCDALDIFWPARADYSEKEKAVLSAYHEIIPEDAKPELLVDGTKTEPALTFSEGPKWMNGKVYFSNMYFDQNWNADPKKSSIVELDPSGSYKNITEGKMQANGLYPYKNGNLIVCDMIGHRVVEMTTTGQVVRVLVDKYDGKPIDGPNDVITDTKGGFYFTDPQFTMEAEKSQPGRAVYYVSPEGKITRIVEPNEFAMPNGILLSPDGKILYINNCYDDESWYPVNSEKDNFIWAYDVNEDGTITNGRQFAKLFLTGNVLDRKGKSSSADGMAIDKMGNIYVGTYYGVQIFNNKGEYVGMINLPSFPVSLCFGDEDMKTLYIVSYSKVYKIRTNMEGYINYL